MSLFLGAMRQHIPGRKELTEHVEVKHLLPAKEVFIPLIHGANTSFEVLVEEGEEVKVGTKLAQTTAGLFVPIYSSVSGTYKGVVKRMHSSLRPQPHMVIELDGNQESVQAFEPKNYETMTREECVDFIKQAGIIGLGGAGFPTNVKYGKVDGVDTILINAVECEPYITADYKMIFDFSEQLILGAKIMKKMGDVEKVYICIKESHPDLIEKVKSVCPSGTGIEVRPVPDVYPMGWERVLVREVLKKEYGMLPSEAGAIVGNASTAIAIGRAFSEGKAITEKYVTISGEAVKNPATVCVPVGMAANEIIAQCGGYTEESVRIISGGPMMGRVVVNDLFVVDRATNAITVLKHQPDNNIACLRCGRCSDHCPSGLQPVRIAAAVKANNIEEMEKRGALSCIECGLCTYICPSKIDVTENVRKAKRVLILKKKK
ncbi:MAG: RnfABCDGE type electron transport complex subunit C [Bacillota bacterium]|nr:RnfABCDGE type electron transport complex subunit C [Bacillota bacterium]